MQLQFYPFQPDFNEIYHNMLLIALSEKARHNNEKPQVNEPEVFTKHKKGEFVT